MYPVLLIIFDLDDTLTLATKPAKNGIEAAAVEWMKHYPNMKSEKFKKTYSEIRKETYAKYKNRPLGGNRMLHFQRLFEMERLPVNFELTLKLTNMYWDEYMKQLKPRPGAEHVLQTLKERGIKIGVLTNFTVEVQTRKLVKTGLHKLVDVMVTAEEVGVTKPDPAMFQQILDKLDVKVRDTLMVGDDMGPDIQGGNNMGMETALIKNDWQVYTDQDLKLPTYQLNKLEEVLKIVL